MFLVSLLVVDVGISVLCFVVVVGDDDDDTFLFLMVAF